MKAPIALALLTLMAPLAFAQQDANALRDQLREIAQPEGTAAPSKTASQRAAAASQAKRTSVSLKPILPWPVFIEEKLKWQTRDKNR